ncbi:MAG: glycosyltransferase family 2 protein [Anaerolineae bacterium]|nr:glycosyltransferase family 2 protein [Anaerolineae bacterium]
MATPKVYISILNWNGYEKTIQCLHALETLDYPNYEIIVVDNASSDGSAERIQAAYPQLTLLCADTNLGYAGGNELALQLTLARDDGDLFWILNNDCFVHPESLSHLVEAYHEHGMALYGGVPLTGDSLNGPWHVQMRLWDLTGAYPKSKKLDRVPYEAQFSPPQTFQAGSLSGSTLLIPLALVREYGYMDMNYFMYSEDADYCLRLLFEHQIPSYLVPKSVIFHAKGGSTKESDNLQAIITYYQVRNRIVLARRYLPASISRNLLLREILNGGAWALQTVTKGSVALNKSRYTFQGIADALSNRMGKTLAPEKWIH